MTTRIVVTLRTIENGNEVTRLVTIEPVGDGSGDWRIVPDEKQKQIQNRYNDKRFVRCKKASESNEAA